MRNALIILVLVAVGYTSAAQQYFSEGYIVTLKHDTIRGKVRDYFSSISPFAHQKIAFINSSGVQKVYVPDDLLGYTKAGIDRYISLELGNGKSFAKFIIDGYISLLTIKSRGASMMSFPNGKGGFQTFSGMPYEIESNYLYNKQNHAVLGVDKHEFEVWVSNFVADDSKLKEMILNKELLIGDIEIIVKMYNKWKEQQLQDKI